MKENYQLENQLKHQIQILLFSTVLFVFIFFLFLLFLPENREKIIYGTVKSKTEIDTFFTKEELNEIQNFSYHGQKLKVQNIEEQLYRKEDGKIYYFVTVALKLKKEDKRIGNYVVITCIKKESRWTRLYQMIRSVID